MSRTPLISTAVLVLLSLSACGGKPEVAVSTPAQEAGHDQAGHAHEEGEEVEVDSTTIKAAMAEQAGIRSAAAQAGTIADEHEVQGLLTPVDGRVAQVTARFPGPVRSLAANVGDRVRAGQVLASINSNLSLTTYRISAPISGVVLSRQAQVGAVAG